MKSRARSTALIILAALVFSMFPAAGAVQPVSALATCDWAQFVADVTIPDGTYFSPGATFSKTWRLKNIGTCTWTTSYQLVFDSGSQMGGTSSYSMPTSVPPGATVDITIPSLTAPNTAGHYIGYWKLKNASGVIFGIGTTANKSFWVEINVSGSGGTSAGYDFTANAGSATWRSGSGGLSFPGSEGSSSGYALRRDRPKFESGVELSQPGMLFVPNNVTNGYIQATYPALRIQSGDRFRATIGCEHLATSCYVQYRLDYQIGSGSVRTFWSFREKHEGLTYPVDLNLSSLAGNDVKFILVVSAYGSPTGDRALWGNPILTGSGGTNPPPPPPPPGSGFNYDFGTGSSPLQSGYTRILESTGFSAGSAGWVDFTGLSSRDRGGPDALRQDFVMNDQSAARTFRVDLPNTTYNVTITMGDKDYAHDNMVVKANGTTVLGDVDNSAGNFAVNTFSTTVTGGNLQLEFSDAGGSDPTWVVNAVSIVPTSTATQPANCTDRAQFVSDVTIPDGTVIGPGAPFSKTWRLKNVGTCTWNTGYSMIFDTGAQMSGPSPVNLPTNVAPGATVDLTINLVAPTTAGAYRGYWKFRNAAGTAFGIGASANKSWWVDIKVNTSVTNTPGTPGTPVTPIAGTSLDFVARMCEAAWFSSAGQLPCPGTDGDSRGFVRRVDNPRLENNTTDSRPGLLTYPQNITNGYIQGIYPPYRVQSGDRFRSIVNCEYNATSCYVVFRLDYQVGTGSIQTLWAFVEKHEGQYYAADIAIPSSLVGQDVKFILTVLATGSPAGDRAMWVAPIIVNGAATATPTLPITHTPSPTNTPPTHTATPSHTPTATLTPTATSPVPSTYMLDFGTASSALQTGYTRVTETTAYTAGGFGWTDTSALSSRDRGAPADPLRQDFVMNDTSGARILKLDLANGTYNVTVVMGDNDNAHDNMVVKADGVVKLADVDAAAGAFTSNTFSVTVSGGSLQLEFSDAGGSDPTWVLNYIDITAAP